MMPAVLAFNEEGLPFSPQYQDIYHSAVGALVQAEGVFLAGNGLPERWQGRDQFVIFETGFGMGLNFLATWRAFQKDPHAPQTLTFISVEKHPFTRDDILRLHQKWPALKNLSSALSDAWPPLSLGAHAISLEGGRINLHLWWGDALDILATFPPLTQQVDAFFLDGFSPAKNPELWSLPLFKALARLAGPEATLATWSVAGHVRTALTAAGFSVEKRPGIGQKKHRLIGQYVGTALKPYRGAPQKAPYSGTLAD